MKAFPHDSTNQYGMDLRDYFAAKAMPKLIEDYQNEDRLVGDEDNAERIAYLSYLMADAMMEARDI